MRGYKVVIIYALLMSHLELFAQKPTPIITKKQLVEGVHLARYDQKPIRIANFFFYDWQYFTGSDEWRDLWHNPNVLLDLFSKVLTQDLGLKIEVSTNGTNLVSRNREVVETTHKRVFDLTKLTPEDLNVWANMSYEIPTLIPLISIVGDILMLDNRETEYKFKAALSVMLVDKGKVVYYKLVRHYDFESDKNYFEPDPEVFKTMVKQVMNDYVSLQ